MNTAVGSELYIQGLGVSSHVIADIVCAAASSVEGVAQVGSGDIASSLISVFTTKTLPQDLSVEAHVEDEKLYVTVHVAVFYGYSFVDIASQIITVVAAALQEQLSCEIGAIDICIDSLVFPKE